MGKRSSSPTGASSEGARSVKDLRPMATFKIVFQKFIGCRWVVECKNTIEESTVPYCAIFQGTTYFLVIGSRHYSRSCHPIHPPAQDGTCDWQSHLATADEAGPLPNPVGSERFPPEDQWALKQKQSQIDKYERVTGSMVVQAIAHTCTHVIYQDISHRSFS